MESHLLQMRGLKREYLINAQGEDVVASFTDAWIETISEGVTDKPEMSHLLQMRGLKQGAAYAKTLAESRIFYRCVD